MKYETAAEAVLARESPVAHRVGWGFMSLYTLAFMSTNLLFLPPLLVTLPLKINALVGIRQAPKSRPGNTPAMNSAAMDTVPPVAIE